MKKKEVKCKNCSQRFVIEPNDLGFYEKIGVPAPSFCPRCRMERRLMWRNERSFYKRECDLCKKKIISAYHNDLPFPVYCQKCWWGDKWDPYAYGKEFDFNKPFFEQFKDLLDEVPMLNMQNDDGIASLNSEYAYDFAFSKNCYLTVCGWYCDNIMYSYYTCYDKDTVDCFFLNHSERCYECFEGDRLFDCRYCQLCFDSMNLSFCYDMRNCQNCFMCAGLRGKTYHIRNRAYTKEEYFKQLQKENLGDVKNIQRCKKELQEMTSGLPRRFAHMIKTTMSTGHTLVNSKLARNSFWSMGIENCSYMICTDEAKDCYDLNNSGRPNMCYEGITPDNSYNSLFTVFCWKCSHLLYSNNCHSTSNAIGCIGIKHGQYCILNKKYSKEEYKKIMPKRIEHMKKTGEWGEFFPATVSPFAYNESKNMDFFPLTKGQAIRKGYTWREMKERDYNITLSAGEVPGSIEDTHESILSKVIECSHKGNCNHRCTTAFRVIQREFQFYKKAGVPVPTLCPNCRHYERLKKRNEPKLWHRSCMCSQKEHSHEVKCLNEFETSYSPEGPEIVYCEECYNKEIY